MKFLNPFGWLGLLFVLVVSLLLTSCSSKSSPITIPVPSYNLNGPEIEASIGWNPVSQVVQLNLYNQAGTAPVTNAAVTLSLSGGGSTPVTYSYSASTLAYYESLLSRWSSGGTYTMSIKSSIGNFTDSVVAVGNIAVNSGTSGVTCTWVGGMRILFP